MCRIWLSAFILLIAAVTAFSQWTEPVMVDSSIYDLVGINTRFGAWTPFVTVDGQLIFFTSAERDGGNYDIYVTRWNGIEWDEPIRMPFCRRNVEERNPTTNASVDTLYFIGYAGNWDIFWCFRTGPEDTSWSEPQRMPDPINSTGIEFAVWCTPDNQRLLISSWRISTDGEDIYECRRDATTETGWSVPNRLIGQLNTWMPESYPAMGFDTTEIFFVRHDDQICVSELTDSGWTCGTPLPDTINRTGTETTPGITADGHRLYIARDNGECHYLLYSDRTFNPVDPESHGTGTLSPLRIYPNPVHDGFSFDAEPGVKRIVLYDLLGRTIKDWGDISRDQRLAGNYSFTSANLPSGTYLMIAEAPKGLHVARINIIH